MDITWHVKHLSSRLMIVVPIILAVLFAGAILVRDIPLSQDFMSGKLIRVWGLDNRPDAGEVEQVEQTIEELLSTDISVKVTEDNSRTTGKYGLEIEIGRDIDEYEENQIREFLSAEFVGAEIKISDKGSVLTSFFKEQAWKAVVGAFIAMAVVLFIVFRHSVAVSIMVLCVALDALGALGGMAIFQIPLSFGSIAGILMIIGYSVDTDILLSNHMLKRFGGNARSRAADAMKTGLMTAGTTIAVLVAINILTTAPLLYELSAALIFGVLADLVNTWFLNVGVLSRHIERRQRREYYVSD
jgi:preprotein translocase subunit SecF